MTRRTQLPLDHAQTSAAAAHRGSLVGVLALTVTYLAVEVLFALLTNSLALLADAGHMLTDVIGLSMALVAVWLARRPATASHTYGYFRAEVLAALANSLLLLGVSGYILYEAYRRFMQPPDVQAWPMLVVATVGLGVNVAGLWLLRRGAGESLNVQGAFLEVMSDALGSVGVIAAGVVLLTTGWPYADPAFAAFIGLFILPRTWRLFRKTLTVLLEAAPSNIDMREVESAIRGVEGVTGVHDLHVWTLTSGFVSLTCHCEMDERRDTHQVLADLFSLIHERYGIRHVTIQPELRTLHTGTSAHSLPRCTSEIGYEDFGLSVAPLPEETVRKRGDDGGL